MIVIKSDMDFRPLRNLEQALPGIQRTVLDTSGKILRKALYDAIARQMFNGPGITKRTLKTKLAKGSNFPSDTWRDMGVLQASLRYEVGEDPEGLYVDVGLFEDALERVVAAMTLEYGSKKQNKPPRPLFRPTMVSVQDYVYDKAAQQMDGLIADAAAGRF